MPEIAAPPINVLPAPVTVVPAVAPVVKIEPSHHEHIVNVEPIILVPWLPIAVMLGANTLGYLILLGLYHYYFNGF